ncbi:hypothetical protein DFJ74DRAFT_674216 [Hyaloraphidium curvatum]|nr:hypothetical protein DFJ74DRAFT_674216 [Hyaloraphidium curvatum]
MLLNSTDPGPQPSIPGPFHDHYAQLRWIVIPVFAHLLVWLTLVLSEYVIAAYEFYVLSQQTAGFATISTEAEEGSPTTGGETTPLVPKSTETGLSLSTRRTERVSRAGTVARNTFIMLLTAFVILSVPIGFACKSKVRLPNPLPDPDGPCGYCTANGVTESAVWMLWSFFGLCALWILTELATVSEQSSIIRAVLAVASYSLIAVVFALTLARWDQYRQRGEDDCQAGH